MRRRTAYLWSACFHAGLFWLIAVADDAWQPEFAVREGPAGAQASRAARAPTVPVVDTRLSVEPLPVAVDLREPVPSPAKPELPADPLESDHRWVVRPPVEELLSRRAQRSVAAAEVPSAVPLVDLRPQTTPESEGRVVPPLEWGPIPEQRLPAWEQPAERPIFQALTAAPLTPVEDLGSDPQPPPASPSVAGAQTEQLPKPFPQNPVPEYPEELRRLRITGTVWLRVTVEADGSVRRVSVERSSGHPQLDASAVAAVERWRFEPARRLGVPVALEVRVPITFTLRAAGNRP